MRDLTCFKEQIESPKSYPLYVKYFLFRNGQVSVHRITEKPVDVVLYEGYVCSISKRDYISSTLGEIYHAFNYT